MSRNGKRPTNRRPQNTTNERSTPRAIFARGKKISEYTPKNQETREIKARPEGSISSQSENKSRNQRNNPHKGGLLATGKKYYGKEDEAKNVRGYIQKRKLEKMLKKPEKDSIRLNKYIANSGICSRREADTLIAQGLVEVNGKVITELGYQVQRTDKVIFDGQGITPEKPVYILLNKPKGYLSTTSDDKARKTVMDLVANASPYRVYPIGRLDRPATGLILLTNDGHMTKKLTHPSFEIKNIYHVILDKKLTQVDLLTIAEGVRLDEGVARVESISYIEGKTKNEIGIEIHLNWNRVIYRIFSRLGYQIEAVDRVMFAGLTKKNIPRGHWRILTDLEVNNLKML